MISPKVTSPKVTSPEVTGAGVTSLSRVAKQGSASEIMVRIRTIISIPRPSLRAGTFDDLTQGDLTQGDRGGRDFALACREAGFCFRNYGSDSNDNFNSATITSGGHFR